ncbi:hypothetical protein V2J09_015220 [Rumex salicifolius]
MADSDNDSGGKSTPTGGGGSSREHDQFLPIANVSRIMKKALPANAKISKDAKETVQECVSEFISFITGEASDKCQREKRKTINGDDLLWAMTTLGFEEYVEPLKVYLQRFRELEGEKTTALQGRDREHGGVGESVVSGGSEGGGMYGNGSVMMMGHGMGGHHQHQHQQQQHQGMYSQMGGGGNKCGPTGSTDFCDSEDDVKFSMKL